MKSIRFAFAAAAILFSSCGQRKESASLDSAPVKSPFTVMMQTGGFFNHTRATISKKTASGTLEQIASIPMCEVKSFKDASQTKCENERFLFNYSWIGLNHKITATLKDKRTTSTYSLRCTESHSIPHPDGITSTTVCE